MRNVVVWALVLSAAAPAWAQEPPPPLPASLIELQSFIQRGRAEDRAADAAQQNAIAAGLHHKLDANDEAVRTALLRIEARQADMAERLRELDDKASVLVQLGRFFTKPETITAIVTAAVTAWATIKAK